MHMKQATYHDALDHRAWSLISLAILELGAEALISQALVAHRDCGDVAKAALRDLGCKVELRELWTGKKGSLSQ
ncbi:Armadillo repeat-containing protein 6 [Acipenser ruthenus]|uniref:Armadillo repeat-containing protein 6 n=1 Tax=Acipenser ruthenus TaxID=7906 RepID=A0A444V549_ACIRT|nr:Armadillo repeat-containing protein 6 [Acipenser ruthenus]